MDINMLVDQLIEREGGYVDHPDDRGGPTNFGITRRVAAQNDYRGSIRDLPRETAARIYRDIYWHGPGYDRIFPIAPRTAAELFDTGVNMGPGVATGFFHRALNALNRGGRDYADVPKAGTITDASVAALKAFLSRRGAAGEVILLRAINALQGARYIDLAERRAANKSFLYGWLANRIEL